jgi:ABC-type phosphate transport system permease subunit
MSTYSIQTISEKKTKLGVIGLVALPIVAAVYSSGIGQVPETLTSGVFPIGFTLFSWGIAAKTAMKLRK